jgi:hypothetical protein
VKAGEWLLASAVALSGCAHRDDSSLSLYIGMQDTRCIVDLGDPQRGFELNLRDSSGAPFRQWRHRHIHIIGRGDVPYRCFGGLIYQLQRTHVRHIGFDSEPALAGEDDGSS